MMEIGNMVFGHSRGEYQVSRVYQDRFCILLYDLGYDSYGVENRSFKGNRTNRIVVRPYWWGDEDSIEATLPNFECKELGLELRWYKYPLRDSYSNIPFTAEIMRKLEKIAEDCSVTGV